MKILKITIILLILTSSVMFLLFGLRPLNFFDFWFHRMLNKPVKIHKIALPSSPDGKWRLEGIMHEWSHHRDQDSDTYKIIAWHNEKPYQGGCNLDQNNSAKLILDFTRPAWVSNSVLAFHSKHATVDTTVALTVVNDTGRLLPCVTIQTEPYYYIFEMAPNTRQQLMCHTPETGRYIGWIVSPQLHGGKPAPALAANKPLREIKMTISDQSPDVIFAQ